MTKHTHRTTQSNAYGETEVEVDIKEYFDHA